MANLRAGLLFVVACSLVSMGNAQPASQPPSKAKAAPQIRGDQQARKLAAQEMVRQISAREEFEKTVQQLTAPMVEQATRDAQARGTKLPPDFAEKVRRVVAQSMTYDEIVQWTAESYAKRMTLDEIHQITAFFRTPAGHKYTLIAPEATSEMMRNMFTVLPRRMEQAMQREGLLPAQGSTPKQ